MLVKVGIEEAPAQIGEAFVSGSGEL